MANPLFFIGIIPSITVAKEIKEFKEFNAKHFNSKKALNSPAHITLIPPFRADSGQIAVLSDQMAGFSKNRNRFYLTINGFGHFGNKVLFVQPEKNDELIELQKTLFGKMQQLLPDLPEEMRFNPHFTIAFRDLDALNFKKSWEHFASKEYFRVFEVTSFSLLKHNGNCWDINKNFPFN